MEKQVRYDRIRIDSESLRKIVHEFHTITNKAKKEVRYIKMGVGFSNQYWSHDNIEEFYSDLKRNSDYFSIFGIISEPSSAAGASYSINIEFRDARTHVSVASPLRAEIEGIFNVVDTCISKLELIETKNTRNLSIFMGMGAMRCGEI